jgi:hypothetical protein
MKYRETRKQEETKIVHDDDFYKKHPKVMRLWLVELSLTSGKSTQFYVTARTQFEAYEKADSYKFWLSDGKLRDKLSTFRLMP